MEDMNKLRQCIEKNIGLFSWLINRYVRDNEEVIFADESLNEIMNYLYQAYDPKLAELKQQAGCRYQQWLILKDIDSIQAEAVYLKYLKLKASAIHLEYQKLKKRIKEIELPF